MIKYVLYGLSILFFFSCQSTSEVADQAPQETQASESGSELPPLIDRELFFGDPEFAGAQISPDGNYLSFRKELEGVMNVWVKNIDDDFEDAWPVTADTTRPVSSYFWSQDSRYILYAQDDGGDENFNIFAVDPRDEPADGEITPPARNLTPLEDIRALIYSVPRESPDYMIIGLNDRNPQYHDVYRLHIPTGEKELLIENDQGIASWNVDQEGNIRTATRQTEDGGTEILKVNSDGFERIYYTTAEENAGISRFHEDGVHAYMVTNRGEDADLSRFVLFNLETGEKEEIAIDPKGEVDFGGAIFSNITNEILAFVYVGDRQRVYPQQQEFARDYEFLVDEFGDVNLSINSRTRDERTWLVSVSKDVNPGSVYIFDRDAREISLLYDSRPDLPMEYLAEMKPVRFTARDGLEIPGYLTIPRGLEAENLPVVINPHGGPWARDSWGYRSETQFLANRGYAVFQINFRGSTGFGKDFLNKGNKEWGTGYMQHDITDGVQFLIEEGYADPERVAIYGGSYGGYATLSGLAFTPELYAAGISFVGPSNIITLLESIPPYWAPMVRMFHTRVGNPDDPDDRQRLKEQSPLFSAENIIAPLQVVQGANDPRVPQAESDQIVVALRELGRDVEYIVAPDEGHGFAGEENRLAFYTAMERFLAEHLEGRFQEEMPDNIQETLERITVDIESVELPDEVAGLDEARITPLPIPDVSHLSEGERNYKTTITASGQQMEAEVKQQISFEDDRFLVVEISEIPGMGTASDSIYVSQDDFLPIYRKVDQGPVSVTVNYSENKVEGMINQGSQTMPIEKELEGSIFASESALHVTLSALPIHEAYQTTFRTFDLMSQDVKIMQLEVTGLEEISVPAGDFEAYRLEFSDMENGGDNTILWIDSELRTILRVQAELPAQMGGGEVVSELQNL